jgi:hypothetical protein
VNRFVLNRTIDHSGISGTGIVAEGLECTDGTCIMRWLTNYRSTCVYDNRIALLAIHGHDGATTIEWIDR